MNLGELVLGGPPSALTVKVYLVRGSKPPTTNSLLLDPDIVFVVGGVVELYSTV